MVDMGRTWTVVRFPNGSWSYGGRADSPDYKECEIWEIDAETAEAAVRKAQSKRSQAKRKAAKKDFK
jgi:hypothetical protein